MDLNVDYMDFNAHLVFISSITNGEKQSQLTSVRFEPRMLSGKAVRNTAKYFAQFANDISSLPP